jgi:hypothetical protein
MKIIPIRINRPLRQGDFRKQEGEHLHCFTLTATMERSTLWAVGVSPERVNYTMH